MKKGRIVVRIEIATLLSDDGLLCHEKMDRLAMLLSNLHNSGKDLLVVTSGAIALGAAKLKINVEDDDVIGLMAAAAIGQAELIKLYQRYFDQYNQKVAQVLLTSDIMKNESWKRNAENTFTTLLSMNIIPIINENDAVSKSDIELDDNYPLALNVADVCKADMIMIKMDKNNRYIIQPCNNLEGVLISNEKELFQELEHIHAQLLGLPKKECAFPAKLSDIRLREVNYD